MTASAFGAVFDRALDAMVILDDRARFIEVNPAACAFYGATRQELLTRGLADFIVDRGRFEESWQRFVAELGSVRGAAQELLPDGTRRDVEFATTGGLAPGLHLSVVRDVTPRTTIERALRESEERYRVLFESSPLPALVTDAENMRIIAVNEAAVRQFGYSRAEFAGMALESLSRSETVGGLAERLALSSSPLHRCKWRNAKKDGTIIDVEVDVHPLSWAGRRAWLSVVTDVTERIYAEAALRTREELFRALVENSSDAVAILSADGAIKYVSPAVTRVLGYSPEEYVGCNAFAVVHPDDRDKAQEGMRQILARPGQAVSSEYRARGRDGSWRVIAAMGVNRLDEPSVRGVVLNFRDVTETRRVEEDLRLRERVVEGMSQGLLIADAVAPGRATIYVNPAFQRITGYTAQDILGQNPRFLQGPLTDQPSAQKIKTALAAGEPVSVEILNYRKDGGTYWNQLSITPIRDEAGRLTHFVGLQSDVTERRGLEDQLRQAQKMEAVGTLAGGVAHDFNNILMVVIGFSEQVLRQLPGEHPARHKVDQIRQAGERAIGLTRQLLAFSRKQVLEPQVLDMNAVVAGLEKMLRRLIGEHIDMVVLPGRDLGHVKADPGQVEQVIMNLVVNARDAMPEGGSIRLETENVNVSLADARTQVGLTPGTYVMLSVADTGIGMDATVRSHIFEPFFTTKAAGKGTGLGLSTVYGIVKQSRGHVGVTSAPGQGSTFCVYLPITDEPLPALSRLARAVPVRARPATVLVAEDEPTLRELVCSSLVESGYTVLESRHAGEAAEICERYKGSIDLLLTDLVMPQMNGRDLGRLVASARSGIRAIYMSGYADPELLRDLMEQGHAFLAKPFTIDALLAKLNEALT